MAHEPQRIPAALMVGGAAENGHGDVDGLRRTASAQQRVQRLLAIGLTVEDLALACDVSETTIRNWAAGNVAPRRLAEYALDDLREAVAIMTAAKVDGQEASQWLRSRNTTMLDGQRPIDVIRTDALLVFAAIQHLLLDCVDDQELVMS